MTESCIRGAWKRLCPHLAVDFEGFSLNKTLSKERLKCLELARRIGLDEVDLLLELIGEELSIEELEELEKQWCQLEEEVEAEQQHLTAPPTKQLTVLILQCFFGMLSNMLDYLEKVDPDYEHVGLTRCRVMADLAHYKQMLFEKRRASMQSTINSWFKKKKPSHPEASATDEPHTSDKPQPGTSAGGYTRSTVSSLLQLLSSSSDVDDPNVI